MKKLPDRALSWTVAVLAALYLAACGCAFAQVRAPETTTEVRYLPRLTAATQDSADVLLTSLDTVIHDKAICCGRDSALVDAVQAADPGSLKDIASKLNGRHLIGDGRPINVSTEYFTPDQVRAGDVIALLEQHAALIIWNSHLYVVHGVVYFWVTSNAGKSISTVPVIHNFLLWDIRFSDSRRDVVLDRETADISKVQGLLFVQWTPQ
jgi:hypothetical protein